MNIDSMPPVIQQAINDVLKDAGVTRPLRKGFVRVEAIIVRLDELSYWDQPMTYAEKYASIEKYLFTKRQLRKDPPKLLPEFDREMRKVIGDRQVIVEELILPGSYPDVVDDEHVN